MPLRLWCHLEVLAVKLFLLALRIFQLRLPTLLSDFGFDVRPQFHLQATLLLLLHLLAQFRRFFQPHHLVLSFKTYIVVDDFDETSFDLESVSFAHFDDMG